MEEYADMQGVKLLNILINQQGPVHCIRLCQMAAIYPSSILPFEADLIRFNPIPMTDPQTLKELDRELNRTINIIALREGQGLPADDLKKKLEMLTAYRKECTFPNGKIKLFIPEQRKAYNAVATAIRRMKMVAFQVNRDAFKSICRHLKIGYYVSWRK